MLGILRGHKEEQSQEIKAIRFSNKAIISVKLMSCFELMISHIQIYEMLKKKPFISHTVDSRLIKLAVISNIGLSKFLNNLEFLFSVLF